VDSRGNSNGNGRDDQNPSDQDAPRLARGRATGRSGAGSSDPTMMAIPVGGGSDLIGSGSASAEEPASDTFRGWSDTAPAPNAPERCKFLRSIGPDGKLFEPRFDAVPTHRCAAFGDPLPLSLRQQELVCLQRVHVSCPRYMRGTLLAEESASAAVTAPVRTGPPALMLAGLAFVALAGIAVIAMLLGVLPGINQPAAKSAGPSAVAAGPTASPTTAATPTLQPTPTGAAPTPSSAPTATPTPAATGTPAPTPVASPTWPPGATASRMKLLVPCTGQSNCWVYTVRGPGQNGSGVADTLAGVVRFFGVDLNAVYDLNPWARAGIHPGDKLKIPAPTR
jgi:hypothetical protein